ncbi:MAG: TPM domain-containing protein [Proteobacteria bacterium]|nr:TPM domain-containing protein [Pseudomonadota bacterium]MBU1717139.1 TPM domain-containing protein [Pseudomonadota bacterium]
MLLVLAITVLAFSASAAYGLQVPGYKRYVNDYAEMISQPLETKLERALQSFDLSDSTQIAILTIPSLEGDSLEEFSIRTVEQWKIGQKGKDNGVLLLVAKKERKIRIEVGQGLEPILTDLLCGRIIDGIMTPNFKANRIDQGFEAGVTAIIQASRGEFKSDGRSTGARGKDEPSPLFKFIFFGLIFSAFLGSSSKKLGITAGGLLFPLAFLFGLMPSLSFLLLFLFVPIGALGAGWLLPIVLAGMFRGTGRGHYGGGLGGGGYRSGGFGGGGFGGFGGGGFGGGGASGGW